MTADQPWVLPLRVHPETPYLVIDADGNQVAECGDWTKWSLPREQRIAQLREAEARAAEIVRVVNGEAEMRELLAAIKGPRECFCFKSEFSPTVTKGMSHMTYCARVTELLAHAGGAATVGVEE